MGFLDVALLSIAFTAVLFLFKNRDQRIFSVVLFAKILFIAFFAVMIDVPAVRDMIVRLNVDQGWYFNTAMTVSEAVRKYGLFINYSWVVGNQNFLYNMILGLYAAANGALNPLSYLLLNLAVSCGIVFFCVRIRRKLTGSTDVMFFALILFLLPSLNIYAMLMLRDLMIGLVVCAFFDALLSRRYLRIALLIAVMYFLRNQFAFILLLAALIDFYLRNRKIVPLPLRISLGGLAACVIVPVAAGTVYGYIFGYFNLQFLYGFFSWLPFGFLGLDFIVQDRSVLAASLGSLIAYRIISPETLLLPLFFIVSLFRGFVSDDHRRIAAVICPVLLLYCFGYYTEYHLMFVRLFIPFYPIFFVLSYDTAVAVFTRCAEKIRQRRVLCT